jgi:hypothetical protein
LRSNSTTSDYDVDKESPDKASDAFHRGASTSAAEESLSDALNGLEQILENRQGASSTAESSDESRRIPANEDSQYTIPLLHDVVVPGSGGSVDQSAEAHPGEARGPNLDDDEACLKLAERLANEIEVIVQARVEAAVREAAEDIHEQVRNHLEIMLPEIIEEFCALGRRQGD